MTKVTVIGSGTMGSGIAQAVLEAGYDVTVVAHSNKSVVEGKERLLKGFEKAVAAGAMTKEKADSLMLHLKLTSRMEEASGSSVVIEAVSEDMKVKMDVLAGVEKYIEDSALLTTNTSSIPIDDLANVLKHKERFAGLHFFNPAPVIKVVEVIKGKSTSDASLGKVKEFAVSVGKTAVEVKDSPGFIANRLLMVLINEAAHALEDGVSTKEGIDTVVRLGLRHPMGPLELADFIGLDVCKNIMDEIYNRTGDARFKPADSLAKLVEQGMLGRKTGKGFYNYE